MFRKEMKSGSIVVKTCLALVLAAGITALTPGIGPNSVFAGEGRVGGSMVFGVENEFAGFDVLKVRGLAICGAIANNTILEPLFRMDDKGKLIPLLGLSAMLSEDGKVWTVKLRQGVKFHDGAAFTADAVAHHWRLILDPGNSVRSRRAVTPITAVE